MKPHLFALGALLAFASACADDKQKPTGLITGPSRPALTLRNLPPNASTVCVATVRKRDQLLAKKPTAKHASLDAAIDDVCQ